MPRARHGRARDSLADQYDLLREENTRGTFLRGASKSRDGASPWRRQDVLAIASEGDELNERSLVRMAF
jgi:hypothetical protein